MTRRPTLWQSTVSPVAEFARQLRALRDQKGVNAPSVNEISERSGVARSTLFAALQGKRLPGRDAVAALVGAWGGDQAEWLAKRSAVEDAHRQEQPINSAVAAADPSAVPSGRLRPAGPDEVRISTYPPRWEHPARRSFWHSLDVVERNALVASAREEVFPAGAALCRQHEIGTDVFVIRAGWTKVTVAAGGLEKIVALRGPGDLVGERAVLTAAPRSAAVAALDDVRALVISADQFRTLLLEQPRVVEVLNRQTVERSPDNTEQEHSGEPADGASRLAGLLLELALRRGTYATDGAVTITVPMTRQEMADWADVPLTEVTWCLNTWQRMGIIEVTEHRVSVIDAAGLEKIYGAAVAPGSGERAAVLPVSSTRSAPLNCSIVATDVVAFGDPRRNDDDRRVVREALYRMMRDAFEGSGVPWDSCYHEDRGDGILTIVPPTVSTLSLVDTLPAMLAARLKRHNRRAGDPVRIQLRCALHVGPVVIDANGSSGLALVHAARMLDAPVLRDSLSAERADLGLIVSANVYDTVVRHGSGLIDPAVYRQVRVQAKERTITAWTYLLGGSPARGELEPLTQVTAVEDASEAHLGLRPPN